MISQYGNTDGGDPGEAWMATGKPFFERSDVAVHRLFVGNYVADHQDRFLGEMAGWLKDRRVKYREDVWIGLDQAPTAFRAMLGGGNFGKTLVRIADDPTMPESTGVERVANLVA